MAIEMNDPLREQRLTVERAAGLSGVRADFVQAIEFHANTNSEA